MSLITLLPLLSVLPYLALSADPVCYSLDGQVLDDVYKPCNPSAKFSACCALNGTSSDNDICLSSGLCQSTSGWFAGFIWADGCTDLLRVGRASVAIRRFVYHSWYEPAGERPRWAGPTGKVQLDRANYSHETGTRPKRIFLCL
jgi:hypothetical protein